MNAEFWRKAWLDGRIGFHQKNINPHLREFASRLELKEGVRILVPLCGKSNDMLWLRDQGCKVFGVEVSTVAVDAFFREHNLADTVVADGVFRRHRTDGIDILEGDYFKTSVRQLGAIDALYDRAALIALPEAMRRRYVEHTAHLVSPGARGLVLTIEYEGKGIEGPPFSLPASEVERLYGPWFQVDMVAEGEILDKSPRFQERGARYLAERVYLVHRNPTRRLHSA